VVVGALAAFWTACPHAMARSPSTRLTTARRDGKPDRRSQCQPVRRGPCLILAEKSDRPHYDRRSQAIESFIKPNDIGHLRSEAPYLYKGAGPSANPEPVLAGAGRSAEPPQSGAPSPAAPPGLSARPSPFKPIVGRGGARNRSSRRTLAISDKADENLNDAAAFAKAAGMPFNRHTTIHWESAGVTDAAAATRHFMKVLARLIRARGYAFAGLWARENGPDKGEHVHILWHGPEDLPELSGWLRRIMKACGARRKAGVYYTRAVGRVLGAASAGGADYQVNLDAIVDYLRKGADGELLASLDRRREPGGEIVGKRCGVTQNIDKAARAKAARNSGANSGRLIK